MKRSVDALGREARLRQIHYSLVDTRNPCLQAIEACLDSAGTRSICRNREARGRKPRY